MAKTTDQNTLYTSKDFVSNQLVRWCPGCGDYAILSAMYKALPRLGVAKENIVFISGIGCASRFPYYINTYGFHTIHGRSSALATGVKIANPALSIWVIQGDGDALAIGGNHFIHVIRRNVDINLLIFNNEIYGLTKGQCSPTSTQGLVTQSTPQGSFEKPFRASELVLGAGGTFFARTVDTTPKSMTELFLQADKHKGTSVVEILQNCIIFNKDAHKAVTSKESKDDLQLHLTHGEPMLFGKDKNKGLIVKDFHLKVVTLGEEGVSEKDILVHDAHTSNPTLHAMLARLAPPNFPLVMGIIRCVSEPDYSNRLGEEKARYTKQKPHQNVNDILQSGEVWEIS